MWYIETISIADYKSTKPLYIAGGLTDDPDKYTVISDGEAKKAVSYRTSHEEADDRMMFSIHQLYKKYTKDSISITAVAPDTDIFVVLIIIFFKPGKILGYIY